MGNFCSEPDEHSNGRFEGRGKPIVTITGVSGFLGSHTLMAFLKDGSYHVRGTVRSTTNAKKMAPLKKAFGNLYSQIEFVEADLNDEASLNAAIKGSTYVVHTASPFFLGSKTEEEMVKPAVDGTMSVVRACREHKVKRLVITSSCGSVKFGYAPDDPDRPADNVFTEEHWTKTDSPGLDFYVKSKPLAEKAAWDYQASLPESERFELVTLLPSMMLGPSMTSGDSTSEQSVKAIVSGYMNPIMKTSMGVIDVRDCALAHLQAIQIEEAKNQRFIVNNREMWMIDMAKLIAEEFNPKGFNVCTTEAEAGSTVYFSADFCSNEKIKRVFGMKFREPKEMLTDMINGMIESGSLAAPAK